MDERKYERRAIRRAYGRAKRRCYGPWKKLTICAVIAALIFGVLLPAYAGGEFQDAELVLVDEIIAELGNSMTKVCVIATLVFVVLAAVSAIMWIRGHAKFRETEEYQCLKAFLKEK